MATITSAPTMGPTDTATGAMNVQPTPFSVPFDCPKGWKIESAGTSSFLHLKPGDLHEYCMPHFDDGISRTTDPYAAQPLTWDGTFDFAPGVCPQDWTAYDIASSTISTSAGFESQMDPVRTAYCCPSAFTLQDGAAIGMLKACAQTFASDGPAANITIVSMPNRAMSGPSYQTFAYGDVIQPAWHMIIGDTWKGDAFIQPAWPDITGSETIATWVPPAYTPPVSSESMSSALASRTGTSTSGRNGPLGTSTTSSLPQETHRCDGFCPDASFFFLVIGLPIIIGLLIVFGCIWCCVRSKRNPAERRRLMAEQRAERELEIATLKGARSSVDVAPPVYSKRAGETVIEMPPVYTPPVKKAEN